MQLEGTRRNLPPASTTVDTLVLDGSHLDLNAFQKVVGQEWKCQVSEDPKVHERVQASRDLVDRSVQQKEAIYGVTTGFGGMANEPVPSDQADQLQHNLLNFLSAGVGDAIDPRHVRGAMLARANMLLRGYSGVRYELIERLVQFLNQDAVPVVKEYGSIGASGDLVPLAAIARAITGHQSTVPVNYDHQILESDKVLEALGYEPIQCKSKEGLALVNGTSFSAAIGANALIESKRQFVLAVVTQGIFLRSLMAHEEPFDEIVHQCKPHPGQTWVAKTVCQLLTEKAIPIEDKSHPVQDRYSIRCLPQYLGPLAEGLGRLNRMIEIELNGVSDNPLVSLDQGCLIQSGNFLGQSIGLGMDELRRCVALTAKHLDVQIALLVAPEFNGGLSPSLKGNPDNPVNMGLKGLQIAGNSIVPMLLQQASPLVEHYPTYAEQFNQNVNGLSWGSANLAWKSVNLFTDYLAIALVFAVQASDLRSRQLFGHFDGRKLLGARLEPVYLQVLQALNVKPNDKMPFLWDDQDRCLEQDVQRVADCIRNDADFFKELEPFVESMDRELGNA